jgi:hypothetical protein
MSTSNRFGSRRSRPAHRRHAIVLALFALVWLSACGGRDDDGDQGARTPDATPSTSPSPTPGSREQDASMPIHIRFGDTEIRARLLDNPTARDLAAAGHDPAAGDIGYWAPGGDFVLYYYDDAPYFEGIVRIGELDGDMEAIRSLPERSGVTIARAG